MYIHKDIKFITRSDLDHTALESVWAEIVFERAKPIIVGTIYRPPNQGDFYGALEESLAGVGDVETIITAIITGDLNTDMQRKETSVYRSYSKCMSLHGLAQLISLPTRVSDSTQTTIDLMLTTDQTKIKNSGVMVCGLSDHYITFCTRKICRPKANGHTTIQTRSLKKYSSENFNTKLAERDWSPVLMSNQVDEAWRQFKTPFLSILCDLAPMTTVRIKARSEPWITPELLETIKARDNKYKEYQKIRTKTEINSNTKLNSFLASLKQQCNKLRNKAINMTKSAKRTTLMIK